VPQFILEDAVAQGRGGACNIVCTQPRRISAVGLAHRVAQAWHYLRYPKTQIRDCGVMLAC